ncbi:TPA: DUF805 domain-containing protein [Providencia alcalifaciens]|uniref:DUF805 domain-containing protein n=1 Tax=Providencia alcalifaciens TaxID=126385 RepID=A0AAW9VBT0_9GAMM|nr:DUF805 domain-containing protein [Providencia sp. 23021821]EKT62595.1 hypothetical protein OO9_18296 [Providencia alcalifaciens Dmel2]MTC35182.1 DUF805 domain-containing protein [Providencia alcalifaciens]
MSSFFNSYANGFRKYFNFRGRSPRQEYIVFTLVNYIVLLTLGRFPLIDWVFYFITFIPGIAVSVRRLHDVNCSGWLLLGPYLILIFAFFFSLIGGNIFGTIGFVIVILGVFASLALFILMVFYRGDIGANRFGDE